MAVSPYLFFAGNAQEALDFYQQALGAEPGVIMRFSEAPDLEALGPGVTPEMIMHAEMTVADGLVMLSDGRMGEPGAPVSSVSLMTKDVAEAKRWYDGLIEGGAPMMPFAEMFFSPGFGMLTDKFGVCWMLMTLPPEDEGC